MYSAYRGLLVLIATIQAFVGVGFALSWSFITDLWIFPYTSTLSFVFIGSIFVAAAASTLWCVLMDEMGALLGVGLDYFTILLPVSIFLSAFRFFTETGVTSAADSKIFTFAILSLIGALFGIIIIVIARRTPIRDTRPQPKLVRYSFVIFIIALCIVGGALVLKMPNVLPWSVTPQVSVIYGWMFLGAAVYFAYSLVRPSWGNSGGQLAGFLAYDLVLILPFLSRFSTDIPANFVSGHILYTVVVVYSAVLSVFFLFTHTSRRVSPAR